MQLKELYAGGYLSAEEYDARRVQLVNQLTGTQSSVNPTPAPAPAAQQYSGYPRPQSGYGSPAAAAGSSYSQQGYGAAQPGAAHHSAYGGAQPGAAQYSAYGGAGRAQPGVQSNIVVNQSRGTNPYAPQAPKPQQTAGRRNQSSSITSLHLSKTILLVSPAHT